MIIKCTAFLEHAKQRDNLCKCIKILGEVPVVNKEAVSVTLPRGDANADKFIELFEQYSWHDIHYE